MDNVERAFVLASLCRKIQDDQEEQFLYEPYDQLVEFHMNQIIQQLVGEEKSKFCWLDNPDYIITCECSIETGIVCVTLSPALNRYYDELLNGPAND